MFATTSVWHSKMRSFVEVIVPRLTGILLLKKFRISCSVGACPGGASANAICFFSSSMADVALWLGPYMSISSKKVICTRTEKVRNCRQIITTPHHTKQPDDPQIPQPDLRFVKRNSKPDTQKGQEPKQKHPQKDLPEDTVVWPLHHTQKHAENELRTTTFRELRMPFVPSRIHCWQV